MPAIASSDRVISLGGTQVAIPERLLLAHARGEVLFIAGAGVSQPAGLPDFRGLVVLVYANVDPVVHSVVSVIPRTEKNPKNVDLSMLTYQQAAEVTRFIYGDFDVVLGMLERRLDGKSHGKSRVRLAIAQELRKAETNPAPIHRALMRLADRGGATAIVTTNFELLLEKATKARMPAVQTYSLGGIPRPSRNEDFSGVFHIHGALDANPKRVSDLVVSDQDFGEFYLRRRVVPDFIYDAARLFHLVLVGYSANDPPMRYLLNAVAADGMRFDDLKERFTFVGSEAPDPIGVEDWKGRGITPIQYDSENHHAELLAALEYWADTSQITGRLGFVEDEVRRIVRRPRSQATDTDRDQFDFLFRRSNLAGRVKLSELASKSGAEIGWLEAIKSISLESVGEFKK